MSEIFPVLGYDIGGTKIAASLILSDGRILGKARIENKDTKPEKILPELVETGKLLIKEAGLTCRQVKAIGIASPSPADIPNGIIVAPPNNKFWRNVHIKEYLSEELEIEAFFENDANAGVLAEWFFGAGKGCKNIVYLTMSTGIGGGIITNGHLVQGKSYYAGEIGHAVLEPGGIKCNCGLLGCYEAYCGGRALAQRMQRELASQPEHPIVQFAGGKLEDIDMLALEKAFIAKNDYAIKLWDEMSFRNAQAFGIILNTLNPEKIILGTLAWAVGNIYIDPILKYLPQFSWQETREACQIVPCELRNEIGSYAGPAVALNCLYEQGHYELPGKK
ncbi:MAG: ROK family protein [Victivallaceae bacterium]